ncbi:MAG: DNA polymerase III subunit beta [Pirellulaceae bacterium]
MRLTFNRESLLAAFQTVATVAPSRSPKPILQCVKISASTDQVVLMATDTEIGIRLSVEDIDVEAPGNAILPVSEFGNILRESTDEKLSVAVSESSVDITGESSLFNMAFQNPDEYPDVNGAESESFLKLPAKLLKELIRRTLYATDNESSRYALGGVLLEMSSSNLVAVGTDGRRLAKMEGPVEVVGAVDLGDSNTIVPSKSMGLIDRALSNPEEEVTVSLSEGHLVVRTSTAMITTGLVEGRFPKWREVFPNFSDPSEINLTVGPVYSKLRQASIMTSDESRGIDFSFDSGTLKMHGLTAQKGEAKTELPVAYDGDPLTISMDHRYVADFLKTLDNESPFTISVQGNESAVLFTTEDGYNYIVMPLARDR